MSGRNIPATKNPIYSKTQRFSNGSVSQTVGRTP